ncbi:hypothetical protein HETIRDRAFT_108561 [Heterobasidion irregulare TC 32-1]|uniref:Uncharacterized protein n=1 Tax=Heterobasidion irregulare (strain TC 32-1) TaxID=747525 RepID=W4JMF3_HETIT|nr:uncharacterized protein HETIRDRAFT_108561 [Heterobasidion irregulare TC 32-1]ETW74708.1 hypothetical protein HETIRDRAFT_108561 [Heterobasidion irregulare TC 32-1]
MSRKSHPETHCWIKKANHIWSGNEAQGAVLPVETIVPPFLSTSDLGKNLLLLGLPNEQFVTQSILADMDYWL